MASACLLPIQSFARQHTPLAAAGRGCDDPMMRRPIRVCQAQASLGPSGVRGLRAGDTRARTRRRTTAAVIVCVQHCFPFRTGSGYSPSPLAVRYTLRALEIAPIRSLRVRPSPRRVLFCDVSRIASMKNAVTRRLSRALVAMAVTRLAIGVGKMVGASATAALEACSTTCPAISAVMFAVVVTAPPPLPPSSPFWGCVDVSPGPSWLCLSLLLDPGAGATGRWRVELVIIWSTRRQATEGVSSPSLFRWLLPCSRPRAPRARSVVPHTDRPKCLRGPFST